jgi:ketosteroid isomerase-like protein
MAEIEEFVRAFSHALETGDADALVGHLAPESIVWHNHDRQEVDAVTNMQGVGVLAKMVRDLKLDVLRVAPTPDGFVMQFVMRGIVTANGKPFEMQNCIVVSMIDGKVTRIDEYVDPTVAAQLS